MEKTQREVEWHGHDEGVCLNCEILLESDDSGNWGHGRGNGTRCSRLD